MVSALGPVLANVSMSKLEKGSLDSLINGNTFCCRYIVYIFATVDRHLHDILRQFNEAQTLVELIDSREQSGVYLIKRVNCSLKRSIYGE